MSWGQPSLDPPLLKENPILSTRLYIMMKVLWKFQCSSELLIFCLFLSFSTAVKLKNFP